MKSKPSTGAGWSGTRVTRYIENLIRAKFGQESNHFGDTAPFNRLVFYECGSEYISLLVKEHPEYHTDLEQMFDRMQVERIQG